MCSVLNPSEDAFRVHFVRAEYLYRDHLGRRVLLDFEGAGRVRLLSLPEDTSIFLDGDREEGLSPFLPDGDSISFGKGCLIVAQREGEFCADVQRGLNPQIGSFRETQLPYEGAGWVLRSEQAFSRDGMHRLEDVHSFPVPFFQRLEGVGKVEICEAGPAATRIDVWNIGDAEALKARAFQVQNLSAVSMLSSTFEDGAAHDAPTASHLNTAQWRCQIPPDSKGLILRKTYDRFHGRQRARVLIEGVFVGWWYEPAQDRVHRWACSQFGVVSEFLDGKAEIEIAIDPPASSPLWSVSDFEVYSL